MCTEITNNIIIHWYFIIAIHNNVENCLEVFHKNAVRSKKTSYEQYKHITNVMRNLHMGI